MEFLKLAVVLQLGLWQAHSATVKFCYYKDSCGPLSWPVQYPTCNGSYQSPIDIKTDKAMRKSHLGHFVFKNYDNPAFLLKIEHSSMSVKCSVNSSSMELSGGGFSESYLPAQFHFHWGKNSSSPGSEHALDGNRSEMELHIVHRRKDLNLTEAFHTQGGLAVLGFLIKIVEGIPEDAAWKNLTKTVKYLKEDGDHVYLNGTVSLMDLINNVNLTKYYRYNGSLTTPECNEIVTWTVFEEPIRLSASLVGSFFRDLYVNMSTGVRLLDNFRPLQGNRSPVWASQGASRASGGASPAPGTDATTRPTARGETNSTTARGETTPESGSACLCFSRLTILVVLLGLCMQPS